MSDLFRVGGFGTTDLTQVRHLTVPIGIISGNHVTLEQPIGTDYQVPTGKTLFIGLVGINTDTASHSVQVGFADDAGATGFTPTNPVFITQQLKAAVIQQNTEIIVACKVPAEKFPLVLSAGGTTFSYVIGIEI